MIGTNTFSFSIPIDDEGFIGRECPSCQQYFKLRPGTGLPTKMCHCPYCEHEGDISGFATASQKEWAKSLAVKALVEPQLKKMTESLRTLERASSEYLKIGVTGGRISLPISSYSEKEVETRILCGGCGLEFAVFGVFARCPDCTSLNFRIVFDKSIELCRKRLTLIDKVDDDEIIRAILQDCISSGVSAFDALGKALRREAPAILVNRKRNLFQDLDTLSLCLQNSLGKGLGDILGQSDHQFMRKMFHVRHLYQHNLGIVDDDAVRRMAEFSSLKGRKYPLTKDETTNFIDIVGGAGSRIIELIETAPDVERKGVQENVKHGA